MFTLHFVTQFIFRTYFKVAIHVIIFCILTLLCKIYGLKLWNRAYFVLLVALGRLPLLIHSNLNSTRFTISLYWSSSCTGRELGAQKLTAKVMWLEPVFVLLYKVGNKSHKDELQKNILKSVHPLGKKYFSHCLSQMMRNTGIKKE